MTIKRESYGAYAIEYIKRIIPLMGTMVSFVALSATDSIMIGWIGENERVGAGIVNSFYLTPVIFNVGLCTLLPSIVAAGSAKNDYQKATQNLIHLLFLCGIIALFLLLFLLLFPNFITSIGRHKETTTCVIGFSRVIGLSILPALLAQPMRKYLQGLGYLYLNLFMTVGGGVLNILLNYFLIYGIGFFPKMGVTGAGVATLVVRLLNLFLLFYVVFGYLKKKGKVGDVGVVFSQGFGKSFFENVMMNFPGGIDLSMNQLYLSFFPRLILGYVGKDFLSAGDILLKIILYAGRLSLAPAIIGLQMMGKAYGENNVQKEKDIAITGYAMYILMSLVMVFAVYLHREPILFLMNAQGESLFLAKKGLLITLVLLFSSGLNSFWISLSRGRQDAIVPVSINFFAFMALGLPLAYLFGVSFDMKIFGVFIGLIIGLLVASFFIFLRFKNALGWVFFSNDEKNRKTAPK